MKKFAWLILLIFCPLVFSACSDDDDDEPGDNSQLIGTWQSVSIVDWEKCEGVFIYGSDAEESSTTRRYVFRADGTVTTLYLEYGDNWENDGTANYSYSNGTLKIYSGGYSESYKVLTLNESQLVIEGHTTYTEDGKNYEAYVKRTLRKID